MNANYDISTIEDALWKATTDAKVCSVVYPNRRPSTTTTTANSFIVVKSVTEIVDKTAFGKNICRIEIYAKQISGVKDSATISAIAKKVAALLPIITSKYEFVYLSNMSLGLDSTGYDVEAYNLNVLIK